MKYCPVFNSIFCISIMRCIFYEIQRKVIRTKSVLLLNFRNMNCQQKKNKFIMCKQLNGPVLKSLKQSRQKLGKILARPGLGQNFVFLIFAGLGSGRNFNFFFGPGPERNFQLFFGSRQADIAAIWAGPGPRSDPRTAQTSRLD